MRVLEEIAGDRFVEGSVLRGMHPPSPATDASALSPFEALWTFGIG